MLYTLIEHALSINDSARCIRQKKLEVKVIRCGLTSATIFVLSGSVQIAFSYETAANSGSECLINYLLGLTTFLSVF